MTRVRLRGPDSDWVSPAATSVFASDEQPGGVQVGFSFGVMGGAIHCEVQPGDPAGYALAREALQQLGQGAVRSDLNPAFLEMI